MPRELKTYRYSCGGVQKIALAYSLNEFVAITGAHRDFSSDTGAADDLARGAEAGRGFYMEHDRRNGWQKLPDRRIAQDAALAQAKALAAGGGNRPVITLREEKHEGATIHRVLVDGEERGVWRRHAPRWKLFDITGRHIWSRADFWARDGELQRTERGSPLPVTMHRWDAAEALGYACAAWEEGRLPSTVEQEAAARQRGAKAAAERLDAQQRDRLKGRMPDLRCVLERAAAAGDATAAELLASVFRAPDPEPEED